MLFGYLFVAMIWPENSKESSCKLLAGFNSSFTSSRSWRITKPMGLYLMQVLDANGKTWLDPILKPLERLTYRLMGVDAERSTTGSNTPSPCCCSAW